VNYGTSSTVTGSACNPSYSGGRDQDYSLKPAWVWLNKSVRIYLGKRVNGVTQDVGP
jgi:hypothetical protein